MRTEDLLRELGQSEIVIFGTGFVAERFYLALEKHRVWGRVLFCMVTKRAEGQAEFHGKPVCLPEERTIPDGALFCLAVHESLLAELEAVLPRSWMERAVWIYPNLWELLFGLPVEKNAMISRRELLEKQDPSLNWISVRYGAIRDVLRAEGGTDGKYGSDRGTDCGLAESRELYVRAMALHCGVKTAEKRYQALRELARSMQAQGFDPSHPLLIDTDGHILDGLHRFAAACALGIDEIPCTVLPASGMFEKILDERNWIPDEMLDRAGVSEEDRKRIREAKKELTGTEK